MQLMHPRSQPNVFNGVNHFQMANMSFFISLSMSLLLTITATLHHAPYNKKFVALIFTLPLHSIPQNLVPLTIPPLATLQHTLIHSSHTSYTHSLAHVQGIKPMAHTRFHLQEPIYLPHPPLSMATKYVVMICMQMPSHPNILLTPPTTQLMPMCNLNPP